MNDEQLFKNNDSRLIESLAYDPTLKPTYEVIRGCLIWPDERPDGLSAEGEKCLSDLCSARALLHRGLTLADHPLKANYFKTIWEKAQIQHPRWPGFARLTLSEADKRYYQEQMHNDVF